MARTKPQTTQKKTAAKASRKALIRRSLISRRWSRYVEIVKGKNVWVDVAPQKSWVEIMKRAKAATDEPECERNFRKTCAIQSVGYQSPNSMPLKPLTMMGKIRLLAKYKT